MPWRAAIRARHLCWPVLQRATSGRVKRARSVLALVPALVLVLVPALVQALVQALAQVPARLGGLGGLAQPLVRLKPWLWFRLHRFRLRNRSAKLRLRQEALAVRRDEKFGSCLGGL